MKYAVAFAALSFSAAAILSTYAGFTDFVVKGRSMQPVMAPGSKVACDQSTFGNYAPGDVVIYQHPKRVGEMAIKTIVAVGGQSVAMRGGRLSIDGQVVSRKVTTNGFVLETLPNGRQIYTVPATGRSPSSELSKLKVPEGHVFVTGNNRDSSIDSRSMRRHGPVPIEKIICRASLPTERI